jgi:4-hydroxy-3-methylbut-2-enyl diphosphate reductase
MGVRRAMDMAGSEAGLFPDGEAAPPPAGTSAPPSAAPAAPEDFLRPRIFTIGPLIHNPQALETLYKQGIAALKEDALPFDLKDAVLIVRAHGITPDLEESLRKRGGRLVDATCPHVRSSQMKAKQLAEKGCHIFLAGEKDHGEIIGIQGYIEQGRAGRAALPCTIVAGGKEAEEAARVLYEAEGEIPCALLAQTTISTEEYAKIARAIQKYFPSLTIINTICGATRDRQEALKKLCGRVEAVIIAGSRESANTRRLLAIARNAGVPAWIAETHSDLPDEIWNYAVVGLSAGASTPDNIILDIEQTLRGSPQARNCCTVSRN